MGQGYQDIFNSQQEYFQSTLKTERIFARKERLRKLKRWIKHNQNAIQDALYKDFKKVPEEVLISEIKPVIGEINHALKSIRDWTAPQKVETPLSLLGTRAKIVPEAKGVCLVIAPWNFPFMLAVGPVVSALAAGNTVVLKPSEMTPHTEKLLQRLFQEVFSPTIATVVTGGVRETQHLLELPWNHIFFTGSPQVGKIIMRKAANHLTSVTLELGGRNPAIVTAKAAITDTARKLVWGKFFNNGQSCVSPNYILIDKKVKEQFIQEFKFEFVEMYGNYPEEIKNNKSLTRIVNQHHYKRLTSLLDEAIENGAKVIFGNHRDEADNYLSPTLLDNVTPDNPIFKEEIFGPILPILTYQTPEEALDIILSTDAPLAFYVFSKSKKEQNYFLKNTRAGTTVFNDTTLQFAHPNLPFGGVGSSGMGKAHGYYGFLEFTNQRAVLKQRTWGAISQLIYPKYNKLKRTIIKIITWYE